MATQGSKRGPEDEGESHSRKRPTRSSGGAGKANPPAPAAKTVPDLVPFDMPEDIDQVRPEDVLTCSNAFSPATYAQDLNHIFSTSANAGRPSQIAMHQVWFRCRRPSADELWSSRYPEQGTYIRTTPTASMRIIRTIERMLEQATKAPLIRRLQILHLDYIMLMCILHGSMERPNIHFPSHEEQFNALVEILGVVDPARSTGPVNPSTSGPIIPEAKRAMFESLRVNADKVVTKELISGYEDAKKIIEEAVFLPTMAAHFSALGIDSEGILLFGPPGTGKSLLAKSAAALSTKCTVFKVSSADLIVKWVGESEQNVAFLFAIAAENAPAIIIIDEIESLCQNRQSKTESEGSARRVATTFLDKMTEHNNVCIIGTTNLPWQLDPAFVRRFSEKVHVGLPTEDVRLEIIKQRLQNFNHNLKIPQMAKLAKQCAGFTGDAIARTIGGVVKGLVLKLSSATHFKIVNVNGQDRYCPCGPTEGGVERTYDSLKNEGLSHLTTTEVVTLDMLLDAAKGLGAQVQRSKNDDAQTKNWSVNHFYTE